MRSIESSDVDRLRKRGDCLLIDVLPAAKFEHEHIPGARSVPVEEGDFARRIDAMAPSRDVPVIVYCERRECDLSPRAARLLEAEGYTNVFDYEGGIEG